MRGLTILTLLLIHGAALAGPCEVSLFEFDAEDQFEDDRTHEDLLGTVSVLVWADRKASEWSGDWGEMLADALQGQIAAGDVQVRGWAHTRGAPFFIKGRIRRNFSEDRASWSILDWGGDFEREYDPREDHVNVFVFDREGCLVTTATGQEIDPRVVARLARAAQEVLVAEHGGKVPGELTPQTDPAH